MRNRLLSADDMSVRMKGRAVHRLSALRTIPSRTLESQDPADAWATLGVLVSKSPRRQAANGGSYAIWTLSDLSRKENDVSVFLFQEALSSHWTVCEGMLVAVLGAKVLPDKGGGGGGVAQRLALSVDVPWQVGVFCCVFSRTRLCGYPQRRAALSVGVAHDDEFVTNEHSRFAHDRDGGLWALLVPDGRM